MGRHWHTGEISSQIQISSEVAKRVWNTVPTASAMDDVVAVHHCALGIQKKKILVFYLVNQEGLQMTTDAKAE